MKVLVTGGAGYVGYSLAQQLVALPEVSEVTIYDNLSRKNHNFFISGQFPKDKIRFVRGELLDQRLLEKEVERTNVIFHLAAKVLTPFADIDSHFFEQVNHWGTATLVNILEKQPIDQFIYLSSLSVYGRVEDEITEDAPLHPESFYGVSKKRAEDHIQRLERKGIQTHIIRSGNVYGFNPCIRFDAVINKFMFDAHVTNRLSIHGSGEQHRAFIHAEKLAFVLGQLIQGGVAPDIYNLAEHNLSINELSGMVQELYPNLENIYINQHLQMRELKVKLPVKLTEQVALPEKSVEEELAEFKGAFSI